MLRTSDITSITEHRAHMKDHLRQVRETGRPLFITSNGQTEAVVLSPKAFDQLADEAELARSHRMLERSAADIAVGRVQPAKRAIGDIAKEFGLKLKRKSTRG